MKKITIPEKTDVKVGETVKINAVIEPGDASDMTLSWGFDPNNASDGQNIAKISDDGMVTGLQEGVYCLRVESDIYFFLSASGVADFNAAQGKNKCTLKP